LVIGLSIVVHVNVATGIANNHVVSFDIRLRIKVGLEEE
jgi:hypothetical protein